MPPQTHPPVYAAARAVGVLKPKMQPNPKGQVFADTLDVRGTAFWLRESRVLITCAHVVQDLLVAPIEVTGLLVVGNHGNYLRALISVVDLERDLAVLRLPPDTAAEVVEREIQDGLAIASSYPSVGAAVGYAGFPFGTQLLNATQDPTYAQGVVASPVRAMQSRKHVQITGSVAGGFSGAPIVDLVNPTEVVAVLSNSPSPAAGQANIFMGVSWEHVAALAALATS